MRNLDRQLRNILSADTGCLAALRCVRALCLPQGAIGAGLIRSAVWSRIAGRPAAAADTADIDVLYLDRSDTSRQAEEAIERRLQAMAPALPWSVRNQARMHLRNGDEPYQSLEDALRYWLETPTCVAVRIDLSDRLEVIAPFGLDDLFAMRIRPTPRGRQRAADYRSRIETKGWETQWPQAVIELP